MGNFKTAFLALVFIGLASVGASPTKDKNPEPTPSPNFQCPSNEDSFHPSPSSCSEFFHCANGLAWKEECPANLHFDPSKNLCVWPEEFPCNIRTIQSPIEVKGQEVIGPAPDFNCPSNGAHAHETDCLLFYDCWEGEATMWTCTDRMLFDLTYHGCNYASQVDCGDRIRPTNVPSTATPPSNITTRPPPPVDFECPEAGGAFPHPELCEYYYTCWEWEPRLDICPGTYLFDLRYMGCNFAYLTDCGDRTRPPGVPGTSTPPPRTTTTRGSTTTTARTTTTGSPSECSPDGLSPHERFCEYYYECRGGHQTLLKCPADWLFDTRSNDCNLPRDVDCGDRERPPDYPGTVTPPSGTTTVRTTTTTADPGTTEDPGQDTTTTTRRPGGPFECPESDGNFADPEDCAWFYSCLAWEVIGHQMCPDGLLFNQRINNCDYPWNVDCPSRK